MATSSSLKRLSPLGGANAFAAFFRRNSALRFVILRPSRSAAPLLGALPVPEPARPRLCRRWGFHTKKDARNRLFLASFEPMIEKPTNPHRIHRSDVAPAALGQSQDRRDKATT